MMIIDKIKNLFNKEDNILETLTPLTSVYEFSDVLEAKKAIPKWWKEMPTKVDNYVPIKGENRVWDGFFRPISTVKHCPAIQDIFTTGIVLKAWADITVLVSPDGIVEAETADRSIGTLNIGGAGTAHPYVQRSGFLKNYAQFKFSSPWLFKTEKYRKFMWMGAFWYNPYLIENNIHIVPGVADFKTQSGTNINMFLPLKKEPYELKINFGDPLVHMIPLDNQPVKIVKKLIPLSEWEKLANPHVKFIGSPKMLKSRIKD